MNRHARAVLGVFLVFLFGCAAGWLSASLVHVGMVNRLILAGPEGMGAAMEKRMTGNISLDPDQRAKIHDAIAINVQERKILQKQIQPEIQVLNRATYLSISSILRPDQQELFKKNLMEIMKHRKAATANSAAAAPPAQNSSGLTTNLP